MNILQNQDENTVQSFGDEWEKMDQSGLKEKEKLQIFTDYFSIFPFDRINDKSVGFDMGCGSGRWATVIAPKVEKLYCIDASQKAVEVAKINLKLFNNVEYMVNSVDNTELKKESFDFGYSLGVLHHVPNTLSAISSCSELLKKGAPFLLYLYYAFDNKPKWYKLIWKLSELVRKFVNKTPSSLKSIITNIIAVIVYFPLSKIAFFAEKIGFKVNNFPLSYYRDKSFYTMRTDSRDRFGTPLEKRFTKSEIKEMMRLASFEDIIFSESKPYWVVLGYKK
jgi:2-polyprenyl-3-methyl-5-hydroxy-6-metoxy-1,4-benzoquinol methylase